MNPKTKLSWRQFAVTVITWAIVFIGVGSGDPEHAAALIPAFAAFAVVSAAFIAALAALAALELFTALIPAFAAYASLTALTVFAAFDVFVVSAAFVVAHFVVFTALTALAAAFAALDYAEKHNLDNKYVLFVSAAQFVLTFVPVYWHISTH